MTSLASAAHPPVSRREAIAVAAARGAVAAALCGAAFSPPVTNVALFIALMAFVCLPSARDRLHAVLRMPIARAALALFALVALGMSWSGAPWAERIQQLSDWRPLVLMLIALSVFSTSQSKTRLAAVVVAFVVLGTLVSFGSWVVQQPTMLGQPPGIVLRNPSTQSMVMVLGLTLSVVLALWRGAGAVPASWPRWIFGAAAGLIATNLLFLTTGRSGQLALAIIAATLVFSLVSGRARGALLAGLLIAAAAVVATSPVVQQRFTQGWQEMHSVEATPELTSMGMRVVMWRTSIEVIKDRPWTGFGTGGFAGAYEKKTPSMNEGWRSLPSADPHNQYLFIWAELGIVGLLALLVLIVVAARQSAPRPYKQISLALLLAWSATSLFSSHFTAFNEAHLLFLMLGVLLAPEREEKPGYAKAASTVDSTPP